MSDSATLPQAHDAETYIASCLGTFPACAGEVFGLLRPDDFVDLELRKVVAAGARQFGATGTIDPMLLAKETGQPKLLVELVLNPDNAPSTPAFITIEAAKIIEARRKRQLHAIAEHASEQALNGVSAETALRTLTADLDEFQRELQSKEPQFPLITALELATARFVLNYLIERVLVEKQPCILGGPKKALKTTIAVLLGICIALQLPLFGKFPVSRSCKVLIASAESGMATIQETAQRICESLGVDLADIENLTFTTNVPKPNDPASLAAFRAAVEESGAEVLILDPFYRMFDGDGQESIFKMGMVLGRLDEMCQELGITLILCHHLKTGRLNQYAPAELDDLAYAGCAEYFRQWLLLSRREAYEPGSGRHALWLTIGGSAGHNSLHALDVYEGSPDDPGGRRFELSIQRADEARDSAERRKADAKDAIAQKQLDEDRTKVFRLMVKHPDGATKTFIRDHCGVSSRRWPIVFAEMFDSGELVTCNVTISNHKTPTTGYRLKGESNA